MELMNAGTENRRTAILNKKVVASIILLAVVVTVVFSFSKAAGTASFSLSPNSGSHGVNTTFTVSIYENSGSQQVTTVDAKLAYDQSKFQLVGSPSTAGSPFTTCFDSSGGGGQISIVCAKLGSSTIGTQLVGKVTFKAIAGSGSTSVSFRSDSHLYNSDSNPTDIWNGNTGGGTYGLTTPSSPAPTPAPPSNSGTPSSPTPSPTPASPNAPSGSTSPAKPSTGSTVARPQSSAQQGNQTTPPTVPTAGNQTGYTVSILVVTQDQKPVKGATVKLAGQTAKTNEEGIAEFANVMIGNQEVQVAYKGKETKKAVDVGSVLGVAQSFSVEVSKNTFNYWIIVIPPLIAILAGGVVFGRAWLQKRAFEAKHFATPAVSPMTGQSSGPQTTSIPYPTGNQPGTTIQPKAPDENPKV